jgi:hypothetical protein
VAGNERFLEIRSTYEARNDLRVPPVIERYNYTIDFSRTANLQEESRVDD